MYVASSALGLFDCSFSLPADQTVEASHPARDISKQWVVTTKRWTPPTQIKSRSQEVCGFQLPLHFLAPKCIQFFVDLYNFIDLSSKFRFVSRTLSKQPQSHSKWTPSTGRTCMLRVRCWKKTITWVCHEDKKEGNVNNVVASKKDYAFSFFQRLNMKEDKLQKERLNEYVVSHFFIIIKSYLHNPWDQGSPSYDVEGTHHVRIQTQKTLSATRVCLWRPSTTSGS